MESINNNNFEEEWKTIEEYDNYEISNIGRVRNIKSGKILKINEVKEGFQIGLYGKKEGRKNLWVHRLVAQNFIPNNDNLPLVDHIDKNTHNNYFTNLRWISYSEKCKQKKKTTNKKTSIYKGVRRQINSKKWEALIGIGDGKQEYLGCFEDEKEAARAYNEKALEYFGEFANLNKIDE